MLIANSLLLMATTYAALDPTEKGKYISTDPSHAEQKIESINFIEKDKKASFNNYISNENKKLKIVSENLILSSQT